MKYTRERMLESFKQLELDLEGNLDNMKIYHSKNDKELADLHKETFDAMYEDEGDTEMIKSFKSYAIEEFNAEYGTSINDTMSSARVMHDVARNVELMFASRDSDDVIDDCENFSNETGQECELVEVSGVYLAILKYSKTKGGF